MKLSEFKEALNTIEEINFVDTNGKMIPAHFHITEAGLITKHFIDCGGTERLEKVINFQLWVATDTDHKLKSEKLQKIIEKSKNVIGTEDLELEVEYQSNTIGKYGLEFKNGTFYLKNKFTNCLASELCGFEAIKKKVNLVDLKKNDSCCVPGSGCC